MVRRLECAGLGDDALLGNRAARAFVFPWLLLAYPTELGLWLWRWYFVDGLCCRVALCVFVSCGIALGVLVTWGRLTVRLVRSALRIH